MIPINRAPIHPGSILKELFLDERNISISALAEATNVSRKHVSMIVNEHIGISSEMALRLAAVFGTSAQVWMNMQNQYDLWHAEKALAAKPARHGAFAPPPEAIADAETEPT